MNYQQRQRQQEPETPVFTGLFAGYRREGLAYIQSQKMIGADPCHAIKPGMPEWKSWEAYFRRRFGRMPWEMTAVIDGRLATATVPAQFAEEFDPILAAGRRK